MCDYNLYFPSNLSFCEAALALPVDLSHRKNMNYRLYNIPMDNTVLSIADNPNLLTEEKDSHQEFISDEVLRPDYFWLFTAICLC